MEAKVYDQKGKETGKVKLPDSIFGLPMNEDLVHQVVVSIMSNNRDNIAHTKNRGDVRGGGKKPWRQKGTGRARHGSNRSPIWRGGGVTFGPRNEKNYTKKINKKMRAKALLIVLAQKMRENEILFVEDIKLKEPKTKEVKSLLENLSKVKGFEMILDKKKNSTYFAINERDINIERSFNNMGNVFVNEVRNLNPLEVLKYKYLVITKPKESLEFLESKLNTEKAVKKVVKKETTEKVVEKEEAPKSKILNEKL